MLDGLKDFTPILSGILMPPFSLLLLYFVLVSGRLFRAEVNGKAVETEKGLENELACFWGVIAEVENGLLFTKFL